MSGQNTPRPGIREKFYRNAYDKIDFELYGDEKSPSHSSAASSSSDVEYVPLHNRIIPSGVSTMISGRPTIHVEEEEYIPKHLQPRVIHGSSDHPPLRTTIPPYPRPIYYATRKTILDHIDKLVPTARYKMSNNPTFEPKKFYLRENPNNGSYFNLGFTIDELLARERQRQRNWDSTYKGATKGGYRSSKRHTHQTKRGKRKTHRRRV